LREIARIDDSLDPDLHLEFDPEMSEPSLPPGTGPMLWGK
jgi:hypothetical protein